MEIKVVIAMQVRKCEQMIYVQDCIVQKCDNERKMKIVSIFFIQKRMYIGTILITISKLIYIIRHAMSSARAVTINQNYQPKVLQKHLHNRPAQIFPDTMVAQPQHFTALQSIATVLSQALSTKDHQLIKQLLSTSTPETIKNTVNQLPPGRLAPLLESIEKILLEDSKNMNICRVVSGWLGQLLKKNIGHIINNPQLQVISGRISRIIKTRISFLSRLNKLNSTLKYHNIQAKLPSQEKFIPKFHYIQEQNQIVHTAEREDGDEIDKQFQKKEEEISDISDIGPEDLENLDQVLLEDDIDIEA